MRGRADVLQSPGNAWRPLTWSAWAATLAGDKLKVRGQVVFGSRVQEVVNDAAREEADLDRVDVVAAGGEQPAGRLGSLSYRIGLLCGCPVFLVK